MLTEVPGQEVGAGRAFTTVKVKEAVGVRDGASCRPQLRLPGLREARRSRVGCMASADARLPPASVVISSTSTAYWAEAEARRFRGTVLERPVGAPTWIYHDHSFDARRGRTAASVPSAPEGRRDVCMIDLFTAMPLEELVTSEHSCIDAFCARGRRRAARRARPPA